MKVTKTFPDITSEISESLNIPAGQVRKVSKALLARIGEAIDSGDKLGLPGLVFLPRTRAAEEAAWDKPARPEVKQALIRRRPSNPQSEAA